MLGSRSDRAVVAAAAALTMALATGSVAVAQDSGASPIEGRGVCQLTLDELNSLSSVQYDAEDPALEFCSYSSGTGGQVLTLEYEEGMLLEVVQERLGAAETFEVGGRQAMPAFGGLMVDVDGGVLIIGPRISGAPDAEDIDVTEYALSIAEIVVPRLADESALAEMADPLTGTLCSVLTLEMVNEVGLIVYDATPVANVSECRYIASEEGHELTVTITSDTDLESQKAFDPNAVDLTVAGKPAIVSPIFGLHVELDGPLLNVSSYVDNFSPASEGFDSADHATRIAELAVPLILGSE